MPGSAKTNEIPGSRVPECQYIRSYFLRIHVLHAIPRVKGTRCIGTLVPLTWEIAMQRLVFGVRECNQPPGSSPGAHMHACAFAALDGIVVVVFINSKGKINIFCLKVLNLKGKTQFLSNYFLRVAKVPAKINDAKGNPSPRARFTRKSIIRAYHAHSWCALHRSSTEGAI